jgi:hypothetical protein
MFTNSEMAKCLDEIFLDALKADESIMQLTEGRIYSTCVDIPPMDDDNTPLPYIIITDDPYNNDLGTKDDMWEGNIDKVQSSVLISAISPEAIKHLRMLIRKAIRKHVISNDLGYLYLSSSSNDGIAWDWQKPCYYDTLHYSCDMEVDLTGESDEQEENE